MSDKNKKTSDETPLVWGWQVRFQGFLRGLPRRVIRPDFCPFGSLVVCHSTVVLFTPHSLAITSTLKPWTRRVCIFLTSPSEMLRPPFLRSSGNGFSGAAANIGSRYFWT